MSSSPQSTLSLLHECFDSCSKAVESGDFQQSNASISELVEFLDSISEAALSDSNNEDVQKNAVAVLSRIHAHIANPSLDQAVIDALSFELPKAVSKFAGVSQRCSDIVENIIDQFTTKCSPRDMISIFCEALYSYGKTTDAPGYIPALLIGLSKVFVSIQRRQLELIKEAVPVILFALQAACSDTDDRDPGSKNLFEGAVRIASSIQETCKKLEDRTSELLRALLGLFVLQLMTLVSICMGDEVSDCLPFVLQLSCFFPYCGFSYLDLVTGQGVDAVIDLVNGDNSDDCMECFSYVKHGAVLSVIWGHISDEISQAAKQDLSGVKNELRITQVKRWQAVGMLKHVFSMDRLSWDMQRHAIDFLLIIMENADQEQISEDVICSSRAPSLIVALQAIVTVIMCAPDSALRRNAFTAFKRVLSDNPPTLRLDVIQALIRNGSSSFMVSILLDCLRENLHSDFSKLVSGEVLQQQEKASASTCFWNSGVLELVGFVLRPPSGGPPSLPEQGDAVLSALNLYRYALITESKGKTNYTGVLYKSNLQKAYNEWLLPLRTLATGIIAENKSDYDQFTVDTVCALNPVGIVLYRCIELVEEKLKESA